MSNSTNNAPSCDIDFYAADTIIDPAAAYKRMLAIGPVVWLEKNQITAICGHAAVTKVLRDHETFSSGSGVSINDSVNKMLVGNTLNSDPPQHDNTRKITFEPVSPKSIRHIRDRIENEVDVVLSELLAKQSFDAASELAPHVPLSIVRDLVGLGDYGKEHMLHWGASTFELMGDPKERRDTAISNLKAMRTFLEDSDTLNNLSETGWAMRAIKIGIENGMESAKAAELMRDYIAPSLDTTISAIGYGIKLFAENPDQWSKLREDRSLMRNALEEIVRLNTPIRAFTRLILNDTVVENIKLKKDARVLVVYGSANRDSSKFENPDQFNIERKTVGHVGFGQGVHACLGMNLARLEMTCLFDALADRVKKFEIFGPVVSGVNSTIHSYAQVPVRVTLSS
ncbi:MAG: cytochrome P450 [Gammaproteobacteria bacterium]|nr:cytochrome P450 [Gammaproteobacteria bacterium]